MLSVFVLFAVLTAVIIEIAAFSLVGVILIARPEFLFGRSTDDLLPLQPTSSLNSTVPMIPDIGDFARRAGEDGVTPAQRLGAVA